MINIKSLFSYLLSGCTIATTLSFNTFVQPVQALSVSGFFGIRTEWRIHFPKERVNEGTPEEKFELPTQLVIRDTSIFSNNLLNPTDILVNLIHPEGAEDNFYNDIFFAINNNHNASLMSGHFSFDVSLKYSDGTITMPAWITRRGFPEQTYINPDFFVLFPLDPYFPDDFNLLDPDFTDPYFSTFDFDDPIEVVLSVPEPLTILGTATALGFGTLLKKRKKSKAVSKNKFYTQS